jgi:D-sedoheptulose 7-phosphate isomerase
MNKSTSSEAHKARAYLIRLSETIRELDIDGIGRAIDLIRSAWNNGNQIIVFGNGGSALTAQHYVTDWNKAIYLKTGRPFRGVCLAENVGLITAYANDFSYEDVFLQQLRAVLKQGDLAIGISGSGNSESVLRPIQYANENGAMSLGICGYDGGKLKQIAHHYICANVNDMQLSEDVHLIFGHMTMQSLCADLVS